MAKIPGQRGPGQFGGDGHRGNRGSFRAAGGKVGKGKGGLGCPLSVAIPVLLISTAVVAACHVV